MDDSVHDRGACGIERLRQRCSDAEHRLADGHPAPTEIPAPLPTLPPHIDVRAPNTRVIIDGDTLCLPQDGRTRYTVHIGNIGNSPAYNVFVTNLLGEGLRFDTIELQNRNAAPTVAENQFRFDIGTIEPGSEVEATVTLRTTDDYTSDYVVIARAETSTPGDPTLNNLQAFTCAPEEPGMISVEAPVVMLPETGGIIHHAGAAAGP